MLSVPLQHFVRLLPLTLLFLLTGCATPKTPPSLPAPAASASVRTTASVSSTSLDSVRAQPLFRQAEQAFQKRQFQKAADLLTRLATTAELTTEQREFVQRQREICLRPLTPRPLPRTRNAL